jgi:asparagine synthase (glutamine-hydrolysing)
LPAWHSHTLQAPDLTVAIERYERLGGYFGLEMRHPLLDIRLLRFSAALPLRQRVRGGWSKYILRRLANGRLPHSVAWREGWEQLGWQFTAGRAEQRRLEGSLPAEAVKERLSPYLKPRPLGYYHGNATGAAPAEELMEMWRHYCLSQWIHSERV